MQILCCCLTSVLSLHRRGRQQSNAADKILGDKRTFCLTAGQSGPDEAQRVLLLQGQRHKRWTGVPVPVSTDANGPEQRRDEEEEETLSSTLHSGAAFLKCQSDIQVTLDSILLSGA